MTSILKVLNGVIVERRLTLRSSGRAGWDFLLFPVSGGGPKLKR